MEDQVYNWGRFQKLAGIPVPKLPYKCISRGVLLYFHTCLGSGHFFGFKILNFIIFGGFPKNEYFRGIKVLWIFLGGYHKIGLYFRVISMHFRVFSEGQGAEWGIFFGVGKLSKYFFWMLEIPDIFWGER